MEPEAEELIPRKQGRVREGVRRDRVRTLSVYNYLSWQNVCTLPMVLVII